MRRHQLLALALLTLVACLDGNRSTSPNFAISDATHGVMADRNPFFFWLPPLVPAPSPTGEFNRFASPVVTVCELVADGSTCATDVNGHPILVAEFSMTSGTGSQVIRVVPTDQLYVVNWRTDLSNLNPTKVYRITASVDGREYGFADVEVGEKPGELKNVDRNVFVPLVDGRTLPITFRIEGGAGCVGLDLECAEAIVDPAAREIVTAFTKGGVALAFGDFPPGWTDEPQLVRITRIDDVSFGPGEGPLGTTFPQYPLFFQYFTTAPHPFRLPVRIGVCNVEDPFNDAFHPHHRPSTVLAMGAEGAFRTLARARADDILGNCHGAEREGTEIGSRLPRPSELLAGVGEVAAYLLAPRRLEASTLMLDGGMGGSTDSFSPAGTVDTASTASGVLYGVNANDDGLSTVDLATGAVNFIGRLSASLDSLSTPVAMASRPSDHTLFVWNNSDAGASTGHLYTVDVCTGHGTRVNLSTSPQGSLQALAFASNDALYGLDGDLFLVAPATGVKTLIGPLAERVGGADFIGGRLYVLTFPGNLATVDTSSGALTIVGPLTPSVGVPGSLVYDAASGRLVGSAFGGDSGDILFDVDASSGAVSNIRIVTGGSAPQGLGFADPCAPPVIR